MENNKKQYLVVHVSMEQLIKKLEDCFDKNLLNRSLIAKTIITNLGPTEMGLSHLYNAFSGIEPNVHVKIGDEVLIAWDHLPTWRINKTAMLDNKYIIKKHYVKGTVENIDYTKRDCIEVAYNYIDNNNEEKNDTYWLKPDSVWLVDDELPENLAKSGF